MTAHDIVRLNQVEDIVEDVDSETLEHKLASLFLSMQTVLHVFQGTTQKIVEDLHNRQPFSYIQTFHSVKKILIKHKTR